MVASDIDSYSSGRVQDQIDHHDREALESQRRFRRLAVLSITASSLTPLLIALEIIISPPALDDFGASSVATRWQTRHQQMDGDGRDDTV